MTYKGKKVLKWLQKNCMGYQKAMHLSIIQNMTGVMSHAEIIGILNELKDVGDVGETTPGYFYAIPAIDITGEETNFLLSKKNLKSNRRIKCLESKMEKLIL